MPLRLSSLLDRLRRLLKTLHPSNRLSIAPGNELRIGADRLRTRVVVQGTGNFVFIDPTVRMRGARIDIHGNGNRLSIGSGALLHGNRIECFGDANTVEIGQDTELNGGLVAAHWGTRVQIGSSCLFAQETDVRTSDSHSILDGTGQRINQDRDVSIGSRVWLARGASVGKGAVIPDDVVVAAKALVTQGRPVPPNSVIGGVPARVIRRGVTWSTQRL